MSRPVPSPSMKGMMGLSGMINLSPTYWIGCPSDGMALPLYDGFMSMFLCGLSLLWREWERITHPDMRGHIDRNQISIQTQNETTLVWTQTENRPRRSYRRRFRIGKHNLSDS